MEIKQKVLHFLRAERLAGARTKDARSPQSFFAPSKQRSARIKKKEKNDNWNFVA